MTGFSYDLYINGDDGTRYPVIIGNHVHFRDGKKDVTGIISDTCRNSIEVSEYLELNSDGDVDIPERTVTDIKVGKKWYNVKRIKGYEELNRIERTKDGLNLRLMKKLDEKKKVSKFTFKPINYLDVIRKGDFDYLSLGMWVNGALEEIEKALYSLPELRSAVEEGLVEKKRHIHERISEHMSEVGTSGADFVQRLVNLLGDARKKTYTSYTDIHNDWERLMYEEKEGKLESSIDKWKDSVISDLEEETEQIEKNLRDLTSGEETTIYGRVRIPAK